MGVCELLDRLLHDLHASPGSAEQVRLVLEAIRAGTGADVVCWLPGSSGGTFQTAGELAVSAEWCQAALGSQSSAESRTALADPGTALMCVSRSRSIWVVAVRSAPSRPFQPADLRLMALVRRVLVTQRQEALARQRLRETMFGLVRSLTAALSAKSPYTHGHSERVARIAVRLGRHLGLDTQALGHLYLAGLLHDVGKIGVDAGVLESPGRLSDEQRVHVEQHPVIGDRILREVGSLAEVRLAVRHHHERWDGEGYPDGLAGEDIPLAARILAVADSCDAMFSARPYRPGMARERVDGILAGGAGTQWDPRVIRRFMACREELYEIAQQTPGDSMERAVEGLVNQWQEGSAGL